jgi:DNA-binding XRE family transcriptional regulator
MTEMPAGDVPQWTLGDRMRKAREHAGLKQSELAKEIGIGRTSVVSYESGRKTPSRPVLLSWAMRCGVDHGWLTGSPDPGWALAGIGRGVKNSVTCAPPLTLAA